MSILASRFPTRARWTVTAFYLVVMLISLPLTPTLVNYLKAKDLLVLALTIFFLAVTFLMTLAILPLLKRLNIAKVLAFLGWTSVVCLCFFAIKTQQERVHLLQYGILTVMVHWCSVRIRTPLRRVVMAVLATTAIGILDEVVQLFLPMRVFDWYDIVYNSTAALLGGFLIFILHPPHFLGANPAKETSQS